MATSSPKQSQDRINNGEWKSRSTKGGDEIPSLGSNPYCCSCKYCKAILKETKCWTQAKKEDINVDIKIGDRVLIQGVLPGVVKYIGDLDSKYTNGQVYIGVKLDDPVGEHDGVFQNKRFFECPNMHGVIVPIEDVNLLVPADGRTMTVKKPDRFFSMPEYADLKSLTSMDSVSSTRSQSETILQTMSESRVTTPLPEYNFQTMVTPPSTQSVRTKSYAEQECCPVDCGKKCLGKKLDNSGVTRSGVFICDHSIAADITDPDNTIKERLLESLSHHCSVNKDVTLDELCPADVDDRVEEVIVLPADPKSTVKVPPTPAPSAVAFKNLKKGFGQPPSASMQVVSNKPVTKLSMGGSKSAATDLKKHPVPHISKLVTNKVTAPIPDFSKPTKSSGSVKKDPSKEIEQVESSVPTAKPEQPSTEKSSESEPVVPVLRLPPSYDEETEKPAAIEPTISYTSRLLSSLPREDAITPLSGADKLNDAIEFQQWAEKWGGGTKGWAKAQTLQKLKDAQRKGKKELDWQKKVDRIEKNEKYAPRVKSIRNLREEILKVRGKDQVTSTEVQQTLSQIHYSKIRQEIDQLEAQTKSLRETNESLLQKVLNHPLFDLIQEAVEFLEMYGDELENEEYYEVVESEGEDTEQGQSLATDTVEQSLATDTVEQSL